MRDLRRLPCTPFTMEQLKRCSAANGIPLATIIGTVLDRASLHDAAWWRSTIEDARYKMAEQQTHRKRRAAEATRRAAESRRPL